MSFKCVNLSNQLKFFFIYLKLFSNCQSGLIQGIMWSWWWYGKHPHMCDGVLTLKGIGGGWQVCDRGQSIHAPLINTDKFIMRNVL